MVDKIPGETVCSCWVEFKLQVGQFGARLVNPIFTTADKKGVTSRSLFPNEGSNSFDGFTSTGKVNLDQNYENSALIEQARACAARISTIH